MIYSKKSSFQGCLIVVLKPEEISLGCMSGFLKTLEVLHRCEGQRNHNGANLNMTVISKMVHNSLDYLYSEVSPLAVGKLCTRILSQSLKWIKSQVKK